MSNPTSETAPTQFVSHFIESSGGELSGPGRFSEVRKPLLDPAPGHVRVRVEACGVCHSDTASVEGLFPISWPRVPGQEVVGRMD